MNECQHCQKPVEFGMTEQGFRGFVHKETGLSLCAPEKQEPQDRYSAGNWVGRW